jgi:imidazolonepropionase-like amidohydrolase
MSEALLCTRTRYPGTHIFRAVTVNAAEMLGWQDRVGAVEPGKFADLVAVAGDPIGDIKRARVRSLRDQGRPSGRNDFASR